MMRMAAVLMTLLTFGCAELRYPEHTEMVPITNAERAPMVTPPAPEPPSSEPLSSEPSPAEHVRAKRRRWKGLVAAGTILTIIGGGLLIGGLIGLRNEQAADARANAIADAQCGTNLFCGLGAGLGDGLSDAFNETPFKAIAGVGGVTGAAGIVLLGLGLDGRFGGDR